MDEPMIIDVTESLARDLLADQHPDLASLPIRHADRGWDNAVFRLGNQLALRIPQRIGGAFLIEHERLWLPVLLDGVPRFVDGGLDASPHLRDGYAACGYPWSWAVVPWHHGAVAASTPPNDPEQTVNRLGRFCAALHRIAPVDAPDNPWRGGPLADRALVLVEHLDLIDHLGRSLGDGVGRHEVEGAFVEAAAVEPAAGHGFWLHGDLHLGNLIVADGALRAVIDFGDITRGDRACDLAVAWSLFPESRERRAQFREVAGAAVTIDDATWSRARAWAIALNVAYLQGEYVTPTRIEVAQRALCAAVGDGETSAL